MATYWITVEAAAAKLGISWHTCRNWCLKKQPNGRPKLRSKVLAPFNHRVVDAADVKRLLDARDA